MWVLTKLVWREGLERFKVKEQLADIWSVEHCHGAGEGIAVRGGVVRAHNIRAIGGRGVSTGDLLY